VIVTAPGETATQAEPEHPTGRFVSGEFFGVLGVSAQLGRVFGPDDDKIGAPSSVVVVSHEYWQTRLAGGDVLGRKVAVNGVPLTIVGVAPQGFSGDIVGQPAELWIPITMQPVLQPYAPLLEDRQASWLLMMGRLAEGATIEQAAAEVHALEARSLTENAAAGTEGAIARLIREQPATIGSGARGFSFYRASLGRPLLTLMAAVALVLLVACANVASLTMVRATTRTREMGVRIALGAGRGRVVRQLLTESLVVAALGGVLGLLLARWGITLLLRVAATGPRGLPLDARLSPGVLAFTASLTIGTAVLFGIVPALRGAGATADLKGRGITGRDGGKGQLPGGRALVVAQVALSTVLLVGTGMLVRSVAKLQQVDLGFDRERTVVATIDADRGGYQDEALAMLHREITRRVGALPGVAHVSYSENGIFSGTESSTTLQVEGFTASTAADTMVSYDDVGPGYFAAVGARLLQGRDIEERDGATAPGVAVVNETMARFFFADGPALGRRVTVGGTSYEIVGVVADAEQQQVKGEPVRRLYLAMSQQGAAIPGRFSVVLLARDDAAALVGSVRGELRAIDPNLTVLSIDPVASLISGSIAQDRMLMRVLTFFGALAMLLAAVGLFGLMAFGAARRTNEFGLRMALGARRSTLARMMLGEALTLVALGVFVGVPAALTATRLIRTQIFGIEIVDPPSVALAVFVLLAAALIAGGIPAVRASRVSPLESLRAE
jgi:predicted permease